MREKEDTLGLIRNGRWDYYYLMLTSNKAEGVQSTKQIQIIDKWNLACVRFRNATLHENIKVNQVTIAFIALVILLFAGNFYYDATRQAWDSSAR